MNSLKINGEDLCSIKKINSYTSIEQINELEYELKSLYKNKEYWKDFDHFLFVEGFKVKLEKNFSIDELIELYKVLSKPFYVKVLKAVTLDRDLYSFHLRQLMPKYKVSSVAKGRYALIKNVFLLHGMGIQVERSREILSIYTSMGISQTRIVDFSNGTKHLINPNKLIVRSSNLESFTINSLARDLAGFRHYELREYLRVMNKKSIQKFLQLYTNYHFLFISNYIEKIKSKSKSKSKKSN